jgi:hypothetical protein
MEDVHQPERFQEQNGIHGNKMISHWRLPEQNGISKGEILLTWKVTRIRKRLFGSIRRSTEPKSDPSVSKVVQQTSFLDRGSTMAQRYTQASLRITGNPSLWMDTHLLEMKIETIYRFKRWPSDRSNSRCAYFEKRPRLPTKVSFKGGSHLSTPKPFYLLASSNLGDEISFKGGSL